MGATKAGGGGRWPCAGDRGRQAVAGRCHRSASGSDPSWHCRTLLRSFPLESKHQFVWKSVTVTKGLQSSSSVRADPAGSCSCCWWRQMSDTQSTHSWQTAASSSEILPQKSPWQFPIFMFSSIKQFNVFMGNKWAAGWAVVGLHNRKIWINFSIKEKKGRRNEITTGSLVCSAWFANIWGEELNFRYKCSALTPRETPQCDSTANPKGQQCQRKIQRYLNWWFGASPVRIKSKEHSHCFCQQEDLFFLKRFPGRFCTFEFLIVQIKFWSTPRRSFPEESKTRLAFPHVSVDSQNPTCPSHVPDDQQCLRTSKRLLKIMSENKGCW